MAEDVLSFESDSDGRDPNDEVFVQPEASVAVGHESLSETVNEDVLYFESDSDGRDPNDEVFVVPEASVAVGHRDKSMSKTVNLEIANDRKTVIRGLVRRILPSKIQCSTREHRKYQSMFRNEIQQQSQVAYDAHIKHKSSKGEMPLDFASFQELQSQFLYKMESNEVKARVREEVQKDLVAEELNREDSETDERFLETDTDERFFERVSNVRNPGLRITTRKIGTLLFEILQVIEEETGYIGVVYVAGENTEDEGHLYCHFIESDTEESGNNFSSFLGSTRWNKSIRKPFEDWAIQKLKSKNLQAPIPNNVTSPTLPAIQARSASGFSATSNSTPLSPSKASVSRLRPEVHNVGDNQRILTNHDTQTNAFDLSDASIEEDGSGGDFMDFIKDMGKGAVNKHMEIRSEDEPLYGMTNRFSDDRRKDSSEKAMKNSEIIPMMPKDKGKMKQTTNRKIRKHETASRRLSTSSPEQPHKRIKISIPQKFGIDTNELNQGGPSTAALRLNCRPELLLASSKEVVPVVSYKRRNDEILDVEAVETRLDFSFRSSSNSTIYNGGNLGLNIGHGRPGLPKVTVLDEFRNPKVFEEVVVTEPGGTAISSKEEGVVAVKRPRTTLMTANDDGEEDVRGAALAPDKELGIGGRGETTVEVVRSCIKDASAVNEPASSPATSKSGRAILSLLRQYSTEEESKVGPEVSTVSGYQSVDITGKTAIQAQATTDIEFDIQQAEVVKKDIKTEVDGDNTALASVIEIAKHFDAVASLLRRVLGEGFPSTVEKIILFESLLGFPERAGKITRALRPAVLGNWNKGYRSFRRLPKIRSLLDYADDMEGWWVAAQHEFRVIKEEAQPGMQSIRLDVNAVPGANEDWGDLAIGGQYGFQTFLLGMAFWRMDKRSKDDEVLETRFRFLMHDIERILDYMIQFLEERKKSIKREDSDGGRETACDVKMESD